MSFLDFQSESPEFLNNYLKYVRFISFNAETTVNEAYFDLRTLLRFIKLMLYDESKLNNFDPDYFKTISIKDITLSDMRKVTNQDLHNFIRFLHDDLKNSPKTRNKKLASLKKLFEYLSANNYIPTNPSIGLHSAKVEKRLPKYLTLEQSKKLLSNTIKSDSINKIRNYAITCIFLNCSLRLSELVGINISNIKIDDSEQTIRVTGKGNKERILYLDKAVCEAIKEYLKVRPVTGRDNPDYDALFLSSRKKRISRRAVQTIIKDEMIQIKEDKLKDCHVHILRHTSTTLLFNENNINIFILKEILGHKSLKATEIYTHVPDKKLKEIMENCTISSILERERSNKNGG